jgi:hypothetical protein
VCILIVNTLQDRGESSTGEWKGAYSGYHENDAHYPFGPSTDINVSKTNCGDSGNCEVEWNQVLLVGTDLKIAITHPCIVGLTVKMCEYHPETRNQMNHYEESEKESHKSIETILDLWKLLKVLEQFVLLLYYLKHFDQPRQLDKLIHSSNSCNSYNIINILAWSKKLVKRNDSKKVNKEPSCNILLCNYLSVSYQIEIVIVVSSVEYDHNINEKHNVYNVVGYVPRLSFNLNKGYPTWSH